MNDELSPETKVDSPEVAREFRMRIDREGNWFFNGQPITNEKVSLYFAEHIAQDNQGNYLVRTNNQECFLEVEDTPFVVRRAVIIAESDPMVTVELNDRTTEVLSWKQLWLKGESQVYCQVKDGRFEARFNRNSQYAFARQLQFDEKEKRYYFKQGEKRHFLSVRGAEARSDGKLTITDGES